MNGDHSVILIEERLQSMADTMGFPMLYPELNLPAGPWQRWALASHFQIDSECVHPVDKLILKKTGQWLEGGMLGLSSGFSNQVTHTLLMGRK